MLLKRVLGVGPRSVLRNVTDVSSMVFLRSVLRKNVMGVSWHSVLRNVDPMSVMGGGLHLFLQCVIRMGVMGVHPRFVLRTAADRQRGAYGAPRRSRYRRDLALHYVRWQGGVYRRLPACARGLCHCFVLYCGRSWMVG